MFNINRNIISKILIFSCLVILLPLVWNSIFNSERITSKTADYKSEKALMDFITQIRDRWENGDKEGLHAKGELDCSPFEKVSSKVAPNFFSCNKIYFECFLKNHFKNSHFKIVKVNKDNNLIKTNSIQIKVKDLILKKEFSLKLENHCHERYLPKNNYLGGPSTSEEYKWDNFLYDLYIDKFYVSNSEFNPDSNQDLSSPVTDVSLKEMKMFCEKQGKILLESRYFDAATFFPSENKVIYKHPYSWTKSHRSFLTSEDKLQPEDCENAYIDGCSKFSPFDAYATQSISWMGINHSLGSHSEVFRNTYEPNANLKVSNQFLSRNSLWHKLGSRGNWKGEDFFEQSFEAVEQYSNKLIDFTSPIKGVAFRCARFR